MSLRSKSIYLFIFLVGLGFGVLIDRLIKYYPYLSLDCKINAFDVANLFVTIVIAIMIPFFVSKLIEDKRGIKAMISEEIKELILIILDIKEVVSNSHRKGVFEVEDRDSINYKFHEAELKAYSIITQVNESFKSNSKETKETVISLLFGYKDYLTGGELMQSSFTKVDQRFLRENNTEYYKTETGLKTLIHRVCKF